MTTTTKRPRIRVICLECNRRFSIAASNSDPQCAKCNGVDIDIDDRHVDNPLSAWR